LQSGDGPGGVGTLKVFRYVGDSVAWDAEPRHKGVEEVRGRRCRHDKVDFAPAQAHSAQEAAARFLGAVSQASRVTELAFDYHLVLAGSLPRDAVAVPLMPHQPASEQVVIFGKRLRVKVGEPSQFIAASEEYRAGGRLEEDGFGMMVTRIDIAGHDRAEPDDAGIKQARLNLDGGDHTTDAVENVEREGTVPSDGRLAQVGPDVLLDEGSERGLAHAVFPVDAGVDQHVDIAELLARMREAGPGGGVGEAPRGRLSQSVARQRAGGFNARAHSDPPGCRW
jgi:hypothetical protein